MLPSADVFATPAELKNANNFTLYSEYGSGKAQKVRFANRDWYIAGADKDGSLVLMCNPSDSLYNMEFDGGSGTIIYRDSEIRSSLGTIVNGSTFTSEERALMKDTTIYTNAGIDPTADKSYLAYGELYNDYITVGANSSGNLSSGIKIGIGNNGPEFSPFKNGGAGTFWLRNDVQSGLLVAVADVGGSEIVGGCLPDDISANVIPAFNLDLSSVLFASGAAGAQAPASFAADSLVLRIKDNDGRIKSTAKVNEETISVTYDDSDADSVYLYVQGKNADSSDWVKSVKINSTREYDFSDLGIGAGNDLSKCQVWLETKDASANLVYAVYAEGGNHKGGSSGNSGSHDGSDSDCDHNFEWQTITAPTATTYGSEGEVCSKCGATRNIRAKSPLDDWARMQINNAKPGDVLKLDFGPWSSYPLWMMQMIADKPTVTYIFNYTYQGNRYEVTIKPGDKFVLDCDWYGALKMPTMFDTVVTKM